jgi:FAD/FMN-containing dehydrogenase
MASTATGRATGLVERGQPGYDERRSSLCWNLRMPDRYPDVIVSATTAEEVAAAVGLARGRGMRACARSSGHSWTCAALRDGGVLVDVSGLDSIAVDTETGLVSAGPGVTSDRLMAALQPYGLTFPAGHGTGVALGGYLLGGGVGWNSGALGIACASIRGIELATASGELVVADADTNPDLLWAVRGGGSALPGIVTSYHLQAYPAPGFVAYSEWHYPMDVLAEVVTWTPVAAKLMHPNGELTSWAGVGTRDGERVVLVRGIAFAGDEAGARRILAPLDGCPVRERGTRVADVAPVDLPGLFRGIDELYPPGRRYGVDAMWMSRDNVSDVLAGVAESFTRAPSPESQIMVFLSPDLDEPLPGDMAFSVADQLFLHIAGIWREAADDERNLAWVDDVVGRFASRATGFSTNETDLFRDPHRATRCFSPQVRRRLREIVRAHDPDGVYFHYEFTDGASTDGTVTGERGG